MAEVWWWLGTTVLGAAWLVAQAVLWWIVLGASSLSWRWRAIGLFPPASAVLAWTVGSKVAVASWCGLLIAYLTCLVLLHLVV